MRFRRTIIVPTLFIAMLFIMQSPAFAVTEAEVEAQVDTIGREAVAGNLLIWFLCAIAFLKISQKIDSFLSGLGINVGHTGGSLMAEAMIAARGISGGKGIISGAFGGKSAAGASGTSEASGSDGAGGMSGGLAGVVGRMVNKGAASNATSGDGGGVGGLAFGASLSKGGDFANQVVGAVATGSVSKTGTMTGERAATALSSYMGYAGGTSPIEEYNGSMNTGQSNFISSMPSEGGTADISSTADGSDTQNFLSGSMPHAVGSPQSIPQFENVEIGGGRIMGTETTPEHPDGISFGMYHTGQYMEPEGAHTTVQAADGETWYKQYAADAVERKPYMQDGGGIAYRESLIKKLPDMPKRKERI